MSFKIRNYELLNAEQLKTQKPDNDIDAIYYEISELEKGLVQGKNLEKLGIRYRKLKNKIADYYKDRRNWVTAKEASELIKTASSSGTCHLRTIRNYFAKGYIRGERDKKRADSRIKLCKADVLSLAKELIL